jgi:hypothetical protein
MKSHVNLLPPSRMRQRAAAVRLRCWVVVDLLAVALAAGVIGLAWAAQPPLQPTRAALTRVDAEITAADSELAALQPRLRDRQRTLEAIDHVRDQPNWAILLTLLSQMREQEAVLRSVRVDAVSTVGGGSVLEAAMASQRGGVQRPTAFNVQLEGLAASQADVSRVVLDCEQTGLFTSVKLVTTAPQTFLDKPATRFELQARIAGHIEAVDTRSQR